MQIWKYIFQFYKLRTDLDLKRNYKLKEITSKIFMKNVNR